MEQGVCLLIKMGTWRKEKMRLNSHPHRKAHEEKYREQVIHQRQEQQRLTACMFAIHGPSRLTYSWVWRKQNCQITVSRVKMQKVTVWTVNGNHMSTTPKGPQCTEFIWEKKTRFLIYWCIMLNLKNYTDNPVIF